MLREKVRRCARRARAAERPESAPLAHTPRYGNHTVGSKRRRKPTRRSPLETRLRVGRARSKRHNPEPNSARSAIISRRLYPSDSASKTANERRSWHRQPFPAKHGAARGVLACQDSPVWPKPPAPRSVSSRLDTGSTCTSTKRLTTSCATRIPRSTVNAALPRLTRSTCTSPR